MSMRGTTQREIVSRLGMICSASAFVVASVFAGPAHAQAPTVVSQVQSVVSPAFLAPPALPPMFLSLARAELAFDGFDGELYATRFRVGASLDQQPSFRDFWYAGTRNADLRENRGRARVMRGTAAGIAMTGGLAMMLGGGLKGGRRGGKAGQAPVVGAGSHTAADLGVVMGSGVLLTSVMMASLPLKGGMRRVRPTPIGGHRWGGMAARWRF